MCSVGDDDFVVFACFKVETTNEILKFSSWGSISFPGAHTSAVTGDDPVLNTQATRAFLLCCMQYSIDANKYLF